MKKVVRLWEYEEILDSNVLYIVHAGETSLFRLIAPAELSYVKVSSHFPGRPEAACLYAWMALGAVHAADLADEDMRTVEEWWRKTTKALIFGDWINAIHWLNGHQIKKIGKDLALAHLHPFMQLIERLLTQYQEIWLRRLPIAWRALGDRGLEWWERPPITNDEFEQLSCTLSEIESYGVSIEPFDEFVKTALRYLKRWSSLNLEDKCWFVSGYLLHHATIELSGQRWSEATIFCHRALDFLFLGCGLRDGRVAWDKQKGGFIYKRTGSDTSVLAGVCELEVGTANFRFVKQLNYARNKSILAHGIDKISDNEASDAARRTKDIFQQLCDNKSLVQWVRNTSPTFKHAWSWLFSAEDSYDLFFKMEST